MGKKGFIKLHRDIEEHWLWNDKPFDKRSAWIDLIMMANHDENKVVLGNQLYEVKRGQRITSIRKLGERWGWSREKVTNFLELLESDGMIQKKTDTKKTLLTIANYSKYQNRQDTEMTQKGHVNDTSMTRSDTNKNVKNEKNEKNYKEVGEKRKRFIPPTQEEVKSYCTERKNTVDPERFVDFYESKGWMVGKNKMKDWKAAVRSWEKKEDPKQPVKKKTDFHLGESRGKEYTNEELEKMLLKKG